MKHFIVAGIFLMVAMITSVNSYAQQGDPAARQAQMKQKLTKLAEDYKVDEIICVTITEDFDDRLTSYKLLAEQFLNQAAVTV